MVPREVTDTLRIGLPGDCCSWRCISGVCQFPRGPEEMNITITTTHISNYLYICNMIAVSHSEVLYVEDFKTGKIYYGQEAIDILNQYGITLGDPFNKDLT